MADIEKTLVDVEASAYTEAERVLAQEVRKLRKEKQKLLDLLIQIHDCYEPTHPAWDFVKWVCGTLHEFGLKCRKFPQS